MPGEPFSGCRASRSLPCRDVTAFAALTGPLPKLGVVGLALLAAASILDVDERRRAWSMLGALVLAPVLLLAEIWNSAQLSIVHRHPLVAAAAAAVLVAVVVGLAVLVGRRSWLVAPLAVLALPFRVPISSAGTTANLLVPLYLVVAAAALAHIVVVLRAERDPPPVPRPTWVERLLALFVVLYGVQALYSLDFTQALQNMVFFYVPFALLFSQLRRVAWAREVIIRCLLIAAALAVIFSCIGFVEYDTKTLLLNSKLSAANDVHTYFTVNSVFFDPDIFGRFLALVMILLAAALLRSRAPRTQLAVTVVLAILWGGLVLTLSRSSLAGLLVGLGVIAALRWKVWPVLALTAVVLVIGGISLVISPSTFGLNQGLNNASSGRANLVTGGLSMFGSRPIQGYGAGAFVTEYRRRYPQISTNLSASHTIPITIAAEQGLIGLLVYLALVIAAIVTLLRGAGRDPARTAVAAAFVALVFHTMLYADFLEDPTTWTLLGVGLALVAAPAADRRMPRARAPTTVSA
jgi:putative inorganic carbon (HCO3(-)) transporter